MELEAKYLNEKIANATSIFFTSYADVCFVLLDDDKIVAIATADNLNTLDEVQDADFIEIHNLGVVEQGRGYGSTLVRMLQERYEWLEAHDVLESAVGFWEKMGFEMTGDDIAEWQK